MKSSRVSMAVARIEAALSRVEAAASENLGNSHSEAQTRQRNSELENTLRTSVTELDRIIARLEK